MPTSTVTVNVPPPPKRNPGGIITGTVNVTVDKQGVPIKPHHHTNAGGTITSTVTPITSPAVEKGYYTQSQYLALGPKAREATDAYFSKPTVTPNQAIAYTQGVGVPGIPAGSTVVVTKKNGSSKLEQLQRGDITRYNRPSGVITSQYSTNTGEVTRVKYNAPFTSGLRGAEFSAKAGEANYQTKKGEVQQVNYTFSKEPILQQPKQTRGETALAIAKGYGGTVLSPFKGLFKAGNVQSNYILLPQSYLMGKAFGLKMLPSSEYKINTQDQDIKNFAFAGTITAGTIFAPVVGTIATIGGVGYGAYAFKQNPTAEQAGSSLAMATPFFLKGYSSFKNVYIASGSQKVSLSEVSIQKVITGEKTFPMARTATESVKAFESIRDPITNNIIVSHATETNFAKITEIGLGGRPKGGIATETQGLYVTPATQTSIRFTRLLGETDYSLTPKFGGKPQIIVSSAKGIERVPMSLILKEGSRDFTLTNRYLSQQLGKENVYLTPRSEKGFLGMGGTREIEATIVPKTSMTNIAGSSSTPYSRLLGFSEQGSVRSTITGAKGYRFYTNIEGTNVPIKEFTRATGRTNELSPSEFSTFVEKSNVGTRSYFESTKSKSFIGEFTRYSTLSPYKSRSLKYSTIYTPSITSLSSSSSSQISSKSYQVSEQIISSSTSLTSSTTSSQSSRSESTISPTSSQTSSSSSILTSSRGFTSSTSFDITRIIPYNINYDPSLLKGRKRRRTTSNQLKSYFVTPLSGAGNVAITSTFSRTVTSPGRERLGEFKLSRTLGKEYFGTVEQRTPRGKKLFSSFGVRL